jgi:hypothetical protein
MTRDYFWNKSKKTKTDQDLWFPIICSPDFSAYSHIYVTENLGLSDDVIQ